MSTTNLNRRRFNNFDCVVADHNSESKLLSSYFAAALRNNSRSTNSVGKNVLMNEKGSLVPFGRNSPRLQIEEVPISMLKRNARSPRVHPEKQTVMLARNIDTFGFLIPCLIDNNNRLLC